MPSIHDMPLDELRTRTNDVRMLLLEARMDVESASSASASQPSLEASVARLSETLARVQELLPGIARLSPESMRRLDAEEIALRTPTERPPPREGRLSASEVARAQEIIAELREGMERMDLLQGVVEGIEDLVARIEEGRAELGRRAAEGT
jgi:hypothetical protein